MQCYHEALCSRRGGASLAFDVSIQEGNLLISILTRTIALLALGFN